MHQMMAEDAKRLARLRLLSHQNGEPFNQQLMRKTAAAATPVDRIEMGVDHRHGCASWRVTEA